MKNNKTQRGGARSAPPLWGGAEGAALLFSIWQWKSGIKNQMEIGFFIKARPNFWPQIENRLWVVLALNKIPPSLNKKHPFFNRTDHYVDFHTFLTHFVPILTFLTGN